MDKDILRTDSLDIGYGGKPLIRKINLSLQQGELTSIIGRNGAGKSTLIKTITGTLAPLSGRVLINNESVSSLSSKNLAKLMAVVTTDPDIAGGLRVDELVGLGRIPYTGKIGILNKEDKEIIETALYDVGLIQKKYSYVGELSDGERQKAMIARGLVQETPIIIMDEPFSYLDVAARLEMHVLLNKLANEHNKAILFSTHDVSQALRNAKKIWLFAKEGDEEWITEGSPEELIAQGLADKIFPDSKIKFDREKKEFII